VRAFVAVTDKDWYQFLAGRPDLDEVNFWQPGGNRVFRTLKPGSISRSYSTRVQCLVRTADTAMPLNLSRPGRPGQCPPADTPLTFSWIVATVSTIVDN
jgi:hypothetical protein